MTTTRRWRIVRHDDNNTIRIRAGKRGGALYWLPVHEIREFADALHDIADDIEADQRGTT